MKYTLLASATFLFIGATLSVAAVPAFKFEPTLSNTSPHSMVQLASDDDHDGRGDMGGGDDDNDSDSADSSSDDNHEHVGDHKKDSKEDSMDDVDDDATDGSSTDSVVTKENHKKVRVPGGSGCDDAEDITEHAECLSK
jgi:hypothetical protein